ncbi:hypothetical protein NQ318_017733 [Aromia moschata]|uniref:Uncharacterized protein n=1 Tax=Aromia moschata TaxID=1265417 RepID=A0AAV8XP67_9CUCU|nr:hypothetical protein NQ318_017733 [Aromia moschata]
MRMLSSVIVFLAVASMAMATVMTSSEELMENIKLNMLKNYLNERQAINVLKENTERICPGYGDKIERAFTKVENCVNDIDEESETMCSAVNNNFEKCVNPVVSLFEECLPEKSKDLPSFIVKSFISVSDYLCKTDGEHIFELSNPCIRNSNYRTQRCVRKIKSKLQQYNSKMPTKEEVCQFLQSFRGCLQSHLQASCGPHKTREAFLSLYDASVKVCDQSSVVVENEIELLEPKLY